MSTVNPLPLSTLAPFAAQPAAGAPARTEIAFVLNNVADWQALAAGVRPGVQVVVLDGTGDGLAACPLSLDDQQQPINFLKRHDLGKHFGNGRQIDDDNSEARARVSQESLPA